MSRIGKMPIAIPAGVNVTLGANNQVTVKGPKGELTQTLPAEMVIEKNGDTIDVKRPSDIKRHKALHGLTRSLLHNMVVGTNEGFKKELEINGVGYRAQKQIIISGPDKQKVGQFAAEVREKRPPEPYKGKGIKYVDEHIRRKEGKTGAKK